MVNKKTGQELIYGKDGEKDYIIDPLTGAKEFIKMSQLKGFVWGKSNP